MKPNAKKLRKRGARIGNDRGLFFAELELTGKIMRREPGTFWKDETDLAGHGPTTEIIETVDDASGNAAQEGTLAQKVKRHPKVPFQLAACQC